MDDPYRVTQVTTDHSHVFIVTAIGNKVNA